MERHLHRVGAVIVATIVLIAASIFLNVGETVHAQNGIVNIEGKQYELEPKSKYTYADEIAPTIIPATGSQFGQFSIAGNLKPVNSIDGFTAYEVSDGMATFFYDAKGSVIGAAETDWHLIEDKSKEVNGEKLGSDILCGAIILQSSKNGQDWITDLVRTNIAGNETDYQKKLDDTQDIELIYGCYYRVIVAYEVERKLDDKQVLFLSFDSNEKKKYVEVYEFYLKNTSEAVIAAGAHPNTKKVVGDMTHVTNTGKDNGFSGQNAITGSDPHYGWGIGEFTLQGYTNTADYQGEEYFLKNLGDAITLNFILEQDINSLNGNSALSIAEDRNGFDQYFQVGKTNFKHGALIVRYTDFQGKKSDPIPYTDYLAAYAKTGADTRVQLFEEGDYEVALDYEIKDSTGIDSYTNYRMFFTFKIRNGNNMVYAFDNGTGSQLADKAWTTTGFTIDTANSHYLTVTVDKYAIVDGVGGKKQDLSWSRTANDGNSYTEGGIYVVTVSNRYQPGGDVSKIFYVGDDPYVEAMAITGKSLDQIVSLVRYTDYDMQDYIHALSKENKSLDEIVDLVKQGWQIDEKGQLIEPPAPVEESETDQENEKEKAMETSEASADKNEEAAAKEAAPTSQPEESVKTGEQEDVSSLGIINKRDVDSEAISKANPITVIVTLIIMLSVCGIYAAKKKHGDQRCIVSDNKEKETEGEK